MIFEKLNLVTLELDCSCKKWGRKINTAKCKVLSPCGDPVTIDNNPMGYVENFVFLGSSVSNSSDEIKRRIRIWYLQPFGRLNISTWKRPELSNDLKPRLYRCLIVPIAIYASETWVCNAEDRQKLIVFKNDCLRDLAGKTR